MPATNKKRLAKVLTAIAEDTNESTARRLEAIALYNQLFPTKQKTSDESNEMTSALAKFGLSKAKEA